MPANTAGGWPYVLPADHPLEFPTHSQALAQQLDAVAGSGQWTSYSPTVGGAVYSAVVAAYLKRGTLVTVVVKATVTSVSGDLTFSLPTQAHTDQVGGSAGTARMMPAGTTYLGHVIVGSATGVNVRVPGTNGISVVCNATTPATWASGNTVQFTITYRSAS